MLHAHKFRDETSSPMDTQELELIICAFKKIYRALRRAQDNKRFLKTNFLEGKESLKAHELTQKIKAHIQSKPKGRTEVAWKLASKFYKQCETNNIELFNSIYKYAFEHTHYLGITLFNSAAKEKIFTKEDIDERKHLHDPIGIVIALELDWSPKDLGCSPWPTTP